MQLKLNSCIAIKCNLMHLTHIDACSWLLLQITCRYTQNVAVAEEKECLTREII